MPNSFAYLTEARDWHGRWTSGDAGAPPDRARILNATYTIVASLPADKRQSMESTLYYGAREALVNLLQAMTANGRAQGATLKAALQNGRMGETAASLLVAAAAALRKPLSPENTKRALESISAAIGNIGTDNLTRILNDATKDVENGVVHAAAQNTDKINRFFDQLYAPLRGLATSLGLPENYILGLSAYESFYYENHNLALKNPFGLTHAGKDNLQFKSVDEAVAYWKSLYGDQVRGATSPQDFAQRLEGAVNGKPVPGWHKYNDVKKDWENEVVNTINSIGMHKSIWSRSK